MPRQRKSQKLHVLEGTERKDRRQEKGEELTLSPGPVGAAPDYLKADALDEWSRLTQDPEYSRALSPAHRASLIRYCFLHGKSCAEMRGEGPALRSQEGYDLTKLRSDLGLTPAAQSRLTAPQPATDKKSKWAGL